MHNFLSAALSLDQCSWRTLDNQGFKGVVTLAQRMGHILSRQEVKVMITNLALFTFSGENWVGDGREDERRFCLNATGRVAHKKLV